MIKNIEWLKKEIGELPCVDTVFNSGGSSYIDSAVPVMTVYDLINEIDETEVLSQEWVDKKRLINRVENYIPLHDKTVGDVINGILEIIKQLPELEVLSPEWIDENQHPYGGDYHVPSEKLEDILVPKQEENNNELYRKFVEIVQMSPASAHDLLNTLANLVAKQHAYGTENLLEEKEQKYYIRDQHGVYLLAKNHREQGKVQTVAEIVEFYGVEEVELDYELTEQEIKDYDERYWAFRKSIEELEE